MYKQAKKDESVRVENSKQQPLKMKTWENCENTYRQAKQALTPKQKRTRLHWAKEKHSWYVDDWMKVIFIDESQICIGQGDDAGTFVWC